MKKILILILFIFVTSSCFADIHRDSYFSKGIKVGNSSITVNADGSFSIVPALNLNGNVSQIFGEYKLGFNFDNDGYVQAYDNDTGLTAYLNYKNCYAFASYNQTSGSITYSTIQANVEDTYYPVKDLTIRQQSGTGYVTYIDNDSDNEGFKFVVGQYGQGLYDITCVITYTSTVSDITTNGAIYKNNVKIAESEGESQGYLSKSTLTISCQYPLVSGDKIAVKVAQTTGAGVGIRVKQARFSMKRISQ